MRSVLKNLILGSVLAVGFSASAQGLDLIEACVGKLSTPTAAEACAGIRGENELAAVLTCLDGVEANRGAACKGVRNRTEADIVQKCVKALGAYSPRACIGVKNELEIQMVLNCSRRLGDMRLSAACQIPSPLFESSSF